MYKSIISLFTVLVCFKTNAQEIPSYQRALQEKTEKATRSFKKGNTISLDFEKAFFGKLKVDVRNLANGDTIMVRLGEKWIDEKIDMKPGGNIRAVSDTFIKKANESYVYFPLKKDKKNTSGRAILLPPAFGIIIPFRAAEITISNAKTVSAERIYYHHPIQSREAYIYTSNSLLDSILQLCMHSIKATTFTGLYVDGDRERIPYEADALINQLSHYVIDTNAYSIARNTIEYLMLNPSWPTEWHLQMHQLVWNDYLYTGNTSIIKKYYDLLAKKTLMAFEYKDGLITTTGKPQSIEFLRSIYYTTFDGKEGLRDITDWPQRGNVPGEPNYKGEADGFIFCELNSVVNAYYYQSLTLMKRFAQILDKKEDVKLYAQKADQVKASFKKYFYDTENKVVLDGDCSKHSSLHANAFALAFGLIEDHEKKDILTTLKTKGMACSVYGVQFLFEALARNGETDHILDLITNRSSRGWYQMIKSGATITAEAWDIRYKPNLDWNHAWGTAPLNIMVREIMGIKPIAKNEFLLDPRPGYLENIKADLPIGNGRIKYELIKNVLTVTLSGNVKFVLRRKEGDKELKSGKNVIRL